MHGSSTKYIQQAHLHLLKIGGFMLSTVHTVLGVLQLVRKFN